jgi:A/G-specific adenine glycosylase
MNLQEFRDEVLRNGSVLYREMPWRNTKNPYYILLSEVMLQQTQVDRVVSYYEKFIKAFPSVNNLADASFAEVLGLWSGLGYNRRAKWLQECAQEIVKRFNGKVPDNIDDLISLPGIGHNTAAAICVYAYNKPENFIETNVRTVFIYHFFKNEEEKIHDKEILKFQEEVLKNVDPRIWYLSLMDYGTFLKKEHGNLSQKSSSYRKQSAFKGSLRQARGELLKLLLKDQSINEKIQDDRYLNAIKQLVDEGFVVKDKSGGYSLKK